MFKKSIIFSFTKSDDIIFFFVISCNLSARESLLSNMVFNLTSLLYLPSPPPLSPPSLPLSIGSPLLSFLSPPIPYLSPLFPSLSYMSPLSPSSLSSLSTLAPLPLLFPSALSLLFHPLISLSSPLSLASLSHLSPLSHSSLPSFPSLLCPSPLSLSRPSLSHTMFMTILSLVFFCMIKKLLSSLYHMINFNFNILVTS